MTVLRESKQICRFMKLENLFFLLLICGILINPQVSSGLGRLSTSTFKGSDWIYGMAVGQISVGARLSVL